MTPEDRADQQNRAANRLPIRLMHGASSAHLAQVIEDMRQLGPPEIVCVWTPDALYALQGVHRLHACSYQLLQFGATLRCLAPDAPLSRQEWEQIIDQDYRSWLDIADTSSAEKVRSQFEFPAQLLTHRSLIPDPGLYKVPIFGAPSAWQTRVAKPALKKSERLRWKEWQRDDAGRYRVKVGTRSATVFPCGTGWKIWVGGLGLPEEGVTGDHVYNTAEEAKAATGAALDWYPPKGMDR